MENGDKNMTKCLVPWVHTYCSPQGERRMCCASREPSQNFDQYIDSNESMEGKTKEEVMEHFKNKQEYTPVYLDDHWNSDHMKSVRTRMMAGEELPECQVCDKKLLNTSVYADYFEQMFGHKREKMLDETDLDGFHHGAPVSFDYRFSNLCNFKCRMCGPMLSSSWEAEAKKHNPDIKKFEPWMNFKTELQHHSTEMFNEMADSIENQEIEEIYFVGGEPLMMAEHWMLLNMMLGKDGVAEQVYLRYNTNLSRTRQYNLDDKHFSPSLFTMLPRFKDWQVCASIDGTNEIGEYIRTGLVYKDFIKNFEEGIAAQSRQGQMRLDFTLTTPGLFEVENMFNLSKKYNVPLLSKVCFEFSPDVPMCPLFLPKDVLRPILENLINTLKPKADRNQQSLIAVLENLIQRETMEEKYPDGFEQGRITGKQTIERLEQRRLQPISMNEIFAEHNEAAWKFWNDI